MQLLSEDLLVRRRVFFCKLVGGGQMSLAAAYVGHVWSMWSYYYCYYCYNNVFFLIDRRIYLNLSKLTQSVAGQNALKPAANAAIVMTLENTAEAKSPVAMGERRTSRCGR